MSAVLALEGVSKSFGGIRAVENVSLSIAEGEILGLIGPNGAGKTALVNLVTGFYRPTAGRIRLDGRDVTTLSMHGIGRAGVARTFQNLRLFRRMSVLENVLLAQKRHAARPFRSLFTARRGRDVAEAMALLGVVGLAARANEGAGALSYGEGRRLEIARALAAEPRLLLLDEPAAGMNEEEKSALAADIARLRGRVKAILLVEHDMGFIRSLASRVAALDAGRLVTVGRAEEVLEHPQVVEAYLGATDGDARDAAA